MLAVQKYIGAKKWLTVLSSAVFRALRAPVIIKRLGIV